MCTSPAVAVLRRLSAQRNVERSKETAASITFDSLLEKGHFQCVTQATAAAWPMTSASNLFTFLRTSIRCRHLLCGDFFFYFPYGCVKSPDLIDEPEHHLRKVAHGSKQEKLHTWDALIFFLVSLTTTFCLLTSCYLHYFLLILNSSCPGRNLLKIPPQAMGNKGCVNVSWKHSWFTFPLSFSLVYQFALENTDTGKRPSECQTLIWSPLSGFVKI